MIGFVVLMVVGFLLGWQLSKCFTNWLLNRIVIKDIESEEETLIRVKEMYSQLQSFHFDNWKAYVNYRNKMNMGIPEDAINFISKVYYSERNRLKT